MSDTNYLHRIYMVILQSVAQSLDISLLASNLVYHGKPMACIKMTKCLEDLIKKIDKCIQGMS